MTRKTALFSFRGVCMLLAVLLVLDIITLPISAIVFAAALVGFALVSAGCKK